MAGQMAPRRRGLGALAEDLDFIRSIHMAAHGHLTLVLGNQMPFSLQVSTGSRYHVWCIYIHAGKHRTFLQSSEVL